MTSLMSIGNFLCVSALTLLILFSTKTYQDLNEATNPETLPSKKSIFALRAPPTPPKRVAVILVGTARTFYRFAVRDNIRRHVIDPLKSKYQTDVFFLVCFDDQAKFRMEVISASIDTQLNAIQSLQPVQVWKYDPMQNVPLDRMRNQTDNVPLIEAPLSCNYKPNRAVDFSHTLFRSKQSMDMLEKYEEEKSIEYDWVYRIRPDVVYMEDLPLPHELNESIFYTSQYSIRGTAQFNEYWREVHPDKNMGPSNIGDHVFIGSRDVAKLAFRVFDVTSICELFSLPNEPRIVIMSQIAMYLHLKNIPYETKNWPYIIARESNGSISFDCRTMKFINFDSSFSPEAAIERCENFVAEVKEVDASKATEELAKS